MKRHTLLSLSIVLALLAISHVVQAQMYGQKIFTPEYEAAISKATGLYEKNQFREAARTYMKAFADLGNKGKIDDRYNAACCWARAGEPDSAFAQLQMIANGRYRQYTVLIIDRDLNSLHGDPRWAEICATVKKNKEAEESGVNKDLVNQLDSILMDDQQYRQLLDSTELKYGHESPQWRELWNKINNADSLNVEKVTRILDKYGWPGPELVGYQGATTVFLVIQHADTKTQDKYLPAMREAVKNHKAQPSSLAMLEDRVALAHGGKQLYGSQVSTDANGIYHVDPIEDPDNVDARRAQVGLGPLKDYVKQWGIEWNPSEHKKQQTHKN